MAEVSTASLIECLEQTWAIIARHHPDLPPAVIRLGQGTQPTQPGILTRGHWAPSRWVDAAEGTHHEMMLAGERLADGADGVLSTLLHEAAHGLATARKIQETSRGGRYHNKRYQALAEETLLEVDQDPTRGWTVTHLTPAARQRYAVVLRELAHVIQLYRRQEVDAEGRTHKPRKSRLCLACACTPPRKFYIARGVADLGGISCDVCCNLFQPQ